MFFERDASQTVKKISSQFKVLLLTGPRQVGKSTLLEKIDPTRSVVSLDSLSLRELAVSDPHLFLERFLPPLLIDEVQYAPGLFSELKTRVDGKDENGNYWLTGSQQLHLMNGISESLAGRVGILKLLGLSQRELNGWLGQEPFIPTNEYLQKCRQREKVLFNDVFLHIWKGSYPALWASNPDWQIFYDSYFQTYLQRDVRTLSGIYDELDFVKFVRAVAARTGQQLNYNSLSKELGISQPTAKSWLSVLEASGLVYLLPPYFNNRLKRLVKSPKVYFTDTGVCAFLSRWMTKEALETGAMSGPMLENFVIIEILKSYRNRGIEPQLYYLRDSDGKEIDLLIEENGKLYPIEIKKTAAPHPSMVKNFEVIPKEIRGTGALVCFVQDYLPLNREVSAIPISYL